MLGLGKMMLTNGSTNDNTYEAVLGILPGFALEEDMATHSSIVVWRTPWTEELGGLQSMGSQRVRHD